MQVVSAPGRSRCRRPGRAARRGSGGADCAARLACRAAAAATSISSSRRAVLAARAAKSVNTEQLDGILTFMNRGPGWLERAIEALFDTERDNAFTLGELCERIYGIKENRPRPAQRNA